jgi:PAS domain S-box-containing protein
MKAPILNRTHTTTTPNFTVGDDYHTSLHLLLNSTEDAMWSVDSQFRLVMANKAFFDVLNELSGMQVQVGQCVLDWELGQDLNDRYINWYRQAMTGESFTVTDYVPYSGKEWAEISFYPVLHEGVIVGAACYARNVTAATITAAKLRNAHDRLMVHVQNTPIGFIEWDAHLNAVHWSDRAMEIFGWTAVEFAASGLSGMDLVYSEDVATVQQMVQSLFAGHTDSSNLQHRNYRRDGSVIWCQWFNSVLRDGAGQPVALLSQVLDITAQKRAEERMVHANRLYSFISHVNQLIMQAHDEKALYEGICRIAVTTGKFEVAWVGEIDECAKKMMLVAEGGIMPSDMPLFAETRYEYGGLAGKVLRTGAHAVSAYIDDDAAMLRWQPLARQRGWRSCISLPIRRSGSIVAVFNLIAAEADFFSDDEVALLNGATNDISFALDVLEKERARQIYEDRLRHSEYRLRQAQAIAHLGSWYLDYATGIATWSEEACLIYGLDTEEHTQSYMSWMSFIHPDDVAMVATAINEALRQHGRAEFHHRIVRKDGEIRYLFTQAEIETNAAGLPVSIHGVSHDVTETRKAQEALALSEANLRLIMDLIPQLIYARDERGNFLFANKSFAALHGLEPEQLLRANVADIFPVNFQDISDAAEAQEVPEFFFTDHAGAERCFRVAKLPYTDAASGRRAVLGIAMDITEQKQLEAERTRMVSDIVQRVKDLEQFSYIVSHNLRAPVANIRGLADILQLPGLDRDEETGLIAELDSCARKLDDVIFDLNLILQVRDKERMQRENVNLAQLLEDICQSLNGQIEEEQVQVTANFQAVPVMHTVKSFIHSIFLNLITNAIKYRRQEVWPHIDIRSERTANGLALVFSDNGLGIDLERKAKHIFGLYKRFHGHVEGKGMGLFMVKTQVELLGGHISVQSMVNQGTSFRIEFELFH